MTRSQFNRVHINTNLPFSPPPDICLRHPRHPFELIFHHVFNKIQHQLHIHILGIPRYRLDAKVHEGIAGKGTTDNPRLINVFRIGSDLGKRIIDPNQHLIDIGAVGKLQFYRRFSRFSGGNNTLQPWNGT